MERTEGTLLGGQVRYAQPRDGYRTGIEPVFLAAAVPARPGERVLEAGCGAGAGLLCLLRRVPGLDARGIEIEPDMATLARDNLRANGHTAVIDTADVTIASLTIQFDHVMANPPWHNPAATRPPSNRRALATHGTGLHRWITALVPIVAPGGTMTLVLPATRVEETAAMLGNTKLGEVAVMALTSKPSRPAKVVLLHARYGSSLITRLRGFLLHDEEGRYTDEAEAVLRSGAAMPFG